MLGWRPAGLTGLVVQLARGATNGKKEEAKKGKAKTRATKETPAEGTRRKERARSRKGVRQTPGGDRG